MGHDRAAVTPAQSAGTPAEDENAPYCQCLFYLVRTGSQWRQLPREFPPFTTVQHISTRGESGVLERINFELLLQARETAGREPNPSAGVIDSQPVRTTEAGGPRGFDAAKKIKGRTRHVVTDTTGLLVGAQVPSADLQDRDGAPLIIAAIHDLFPWLRHLFANSAYAGDKLLNTLTKFGNWTIVVVPGMPTLRPQRLSMRLSLRSQWRWFW